MSVFIPEKPRRLPLFCFISYGWALISLILFFCFRASESFSDRFNATVGAFGRELLGRLTSPIPFSLGEAIVILIPFFLIFFSVIAFRFYSDSAHSALIYGGKLLSVVCVLFSVFVFNFASGYTASPLDEKLGLERRVVSADELYATASALSEELYALEGEVVFLPDGSSYMPYSLAEMNAKLTDAYRKASEKYGFLDTFPSSVKPIMLSEPLSYTHITGVYSFFTGEANLNVNFPDYCLPFTAAHELAHQRGFAREDEANFVAYLVSLESDDPYLRYSAALNLYEYVANALYSADPSLYRELYASLPVSVRGEERAYSAFFDRYRESTAAKVSEATNNTYLQSQGVKAGSRSYGMVVDLAVAFHNANRQDSDDD